MSQLHDIEATLRMECNLPMTLRQKCRMLKFVFLQVNSVIMIVFTAVNLAADLLVVLFSDLWSAPLAACDFQHNSSHEIGFLENHVLVKST